MLRFVFFLTIVFVGLSCTSSLGFQTAKTLEEDRVLLAWTSDASITTRLKPQSHVVGYGINPFLGFAFRSGTRVKNLDWGYQLGWQSPLGADVKYQFIGDRKSFFAAATGLGLGWIPPLWSSFGKGSIWDFKSLYTATVPVFLTFDFDDKSAITFTPSYRYAANPLYSFHAAIFNLSMRFRTKNTEDLRRYFTVELYAGRSFAGTYRYNNLFFGGVALGFQGINRRLSPEERFKRKRKKDSHKVFFEY